MTLLVCLSLLGYCFILKRLTKWPIECLPFFVISSCIALLYGAAYAHSLLMAANAILISGAFSLLISLVILYQERNQLWSEYLTPGFVLLLFITTFFLILTNGAHLSGWDEFTHWGPHSKLVLFHNGFIEASDITINKTYPLGGALFHYLFFRSTGYSESVAYIAQCLLTLAPLSILVSRFHWCEWKKVFIGYALTLFFLFLLKIQIGVVNTLYMDNIVGIYFGMAIVFYLVSAKNVLSILYLIPIIISLTLFKEKLYPFTVIIAVLMMLDKIFIQKQKKLGMIFLPLLLPLISLLTTKSWNHYLFSIHEGLERQLHLTPSILWHTFLPSKDSLSHTIIMNYFHGLVPQTIFLAVIGIVAFFTYFQYQHKKEKTNFLIVSFFMLLGFCVYIFGLLIMYLFAFVPYEAIHHASMGRYLNIYEIGWTLVAIYFLIDTQRYKKYSSYFSNTIIFITVLLGLLPIHFLHQRNYDHQLYSAWSLRQSIIQIGAAVNKKTEPNAKIYTVWQNTNGFERGILIYELVPRSPELEGAFSFGKPYTPEDVWTSNITPHEFLRIAGKNDYVLVAYSDKNFWEHYGSIMPAHPMPLITYTICHGNSFNSFGSPGCVMKQYPAYLFKVVHDGNKVILK